MAAANPIKHVVIIVKENHTFDNYFGTFPGANGVTGLSRALDQPPSDPRHDHAAWLRRADPPPHGARREQYLEADIPAYFAYARQFTLCDNYFTAVASQSEPNHLVLIAAASPIIDNSNAHRTYQPQLPFDLPSLPTSLEAKGLTWRNYGGFYHQHIAALAGSPHNVSTDDFDKDVDAKALPSVSWLYASESHGHGRGGGQSEHPTDSVRAGMLWTVDRVNKVANSRYWDNTAIFITWDDWGGWFDHVEPPLAEKWTGRGPQGYHNSQFRFGPRVGCLVLSPFAKRNHLSSVTSGPTTVRSHASLVRFCERVFGLGTLGALDVAADDMSDCFDFATKHLDRPTWAPGP